MSTSTNADRTDAELAETALIPASARPLLAPAGAAYAAALVSVGVIATGGVGIRDGVLAAGWITGSSWTGACVDWVDGLTFATWMTFAGVALAIVGVGFVILAVKPRRKTSVEVSSRSSVAISHADVARVAASAARAIPGVVDARATSTRKKLTIKARTTAGRDDSAAVKSTVSDAVADAVALLSSPPENHRSHSARRPQMTRSALALDRIVALLVGLVMIAVGVAAIGWNTYLRNVIPERVTVPGLVSATQQAWWPWATAAVGVVLVLLGLRWLLSHSPAAKAAAVALPGSGEQGRLSADLGAIADAVSKLLEGEPSVKSAKAKAIDDRGRATLDITATATSAADLAAAAAAADRVCCDAATMFGDDSVATRTRIRVPSRDGERRVA